MHNTLAEPLSFTLGEFRRHRVSLCVFFGGGKEIVSLRKMGESAGAYPSMCTSVCLYACMHACMYVGRAVCMCIYICVCMYRYPKA